MDGRRRGLVWSHAQRGRQGRWQRRRLRRLRPCLRWLRRRLGRHRCCPQLGLSLPQGFRALLNLQRSPEALLGEIKRQRLLRCEKELALLGLDPERAHTLTEADVRAARAAKAKDLHPDQWLARRAVAADAPTPWDALDSLSSGAAPEEEAAPEDPHAAMSALNAAHDVVRKAVTEPLTDVFFKG